MSFMAFLSGQFSGEGIREFLGKGKNRLRERLKKRAGDSVIGTPLKEKKVRYRGRGRSGLGTMAIVIGTFGWLIFVVMLHRVRTGAASVRQGAVLAVLDAVLGLFGLVLSGRGLRENNVYYLAALAGALLSGLLVVTYLVLLLVGAALG